MCGLRVATGAVALIARHREVAAFAAPLTRGGMRAAAAAFLAGQIHGGLVLSAAAAFAALRIADLTGTLTNEAQLSIKVNRAASAAQPARAGMSAGSTANLAIESFSSGAAALEALAVDARCDVIPEKARAVIALNGRSVGALSVFVGTTPKAFLHFAFLDDPPVLFCFRPGCRAEESGPVRVGLLLAAVVVFHDLLSVTPEVLFVMDGSPEPEGGFDEGLKETAAATSAHNVCGFLVSGEGTLREPRLCEVPAAPIRTEDATGPVLRVQRP